MAVPRDGGGLPRFGQGKGSGVGDAFGQQPVGRSVLIGFAITVVVLLGNAAASYRATLKLVENERLVAHTHQVIGEVEELVSSVKDAETGHRGFLVTGEAAFLGPYDAAPAEIEQHQQALDRLLADNPDQLRRLVDLNAKIAGKRLEMARVLDVYSAGGFEAARRTVSAGVGKNLMDDVRRISAEMIDHEEALLAVRARESAESGRNAYITLAVATGLTLGLVILVFSLIRRDAQTRAKVEFALRAANEELEERVRERTIEIERANLELERSNRELQDFAFVASHDLQEPLRKIQAFGDRLRMKYAEQLGDGADYLSRMQSAAGRMHALINDLLTFSRVTSKAQPFVPVNLATVATEVVSDLEARIDQTGGRVEVGDLPEIEADPTQMRQLFQNLLGNALKFHRPDAAPVVKVHGATRDGTFTLEISDNGIGFEEKYLDRIFTPFQRLHSRQEYEGTGMGLAVCRKIVERHGGTITARSAPDAGTTFRVELPVEQTQGARTSE